MKKILIVGSLWILLVLIILLGDYTSAYFSDREVSTGNIIQVGVWVVADSDCISLINRTDAKLTGNGKELHNIFLKNNCSKDVAVDRINVSWNTSGNVTTVSFRGKGNAFWSGSESSPASLDGEEIFQASSTKNLRLWFDSDMHGSVFNILLIMNDGSNKDIEVGPFEKNNN
ncbi:MAG: SipW-dependent-type signal peptide-containing protein [Candidatus Thorarchaeota archaeon]